MLLNSWSLALSLSGLLVIFLLAVAARSTLRVIRHWNPASDDGLQVDLESEIWLSSTLVAYALAIQITGLVLFVMAADSFAEVLSGAMCATGALLAVTVAISSYIYAMPFHNCPFCILQPEYGYISFAIYGTLLTAVFFGLVATLAGLFRGYPGLAAPVADLRQGALVSSLALLLLFALFSSFHFICYLLLGGEM